MSASVLTVIVCLASVASVVAIGVALGRMLREADRGDEAERLAGLGVRDPEPAVPAEEELSQGAAAHTWPPRGAPRT